MMDKKEFFEETYNTLVPLRQLKCGLVVYNKPHFKNNIICITTDIQEIEKRLSQGWSIYPGKYKYILQAPETVLCDLSEMAVNPTTDIIEIFTLFRALKSINIIEFMEKNGLGRTIFKNLEICSINGLSSQLEIRVVGSDHRIHQIPKILYTILKKTDVWQEKYKESKKTLKSRIINIKTLDLSKCHRITKEYNNELKKIYNIFDGINLPRKAVFNFWHDLPKFDVYVFVPKSGLKYTYGFIEEMRSTRNIMLWECHLSLDQTKEIKIFRKILKNKKVAIIDRSYSGNTLLYLKKRVIAEGGKPFTVALFPKSKIGVQSSELFLFLDRLIPSDKINFVENWGENLFINVVNNKKI